MNLVEGLLQQINRNKELLQAYKEIPTGAFGATMIESDILNAERALGSGDVVAMVKWHRELENNE